MAKLVSFRASRLLPLALFALALALVGPKIVRPGAAASAAGSPGATVYHDALGSGWADWSWNATINFGSASPVYAGNRSIRLTVTRAWGAIQLHSDAGVAAAQYPYLTFAARASRSGQSYTVALTDTHNQQFAPFLPLTKYGGDPVTGAWKLYTIPVADLGAAGKQVGGFVLQESQGTAQPAVYLDEIAFTSAPGQTPPPATPSPTATPAPTNGNGNRVMGYFPIWLANSGYTYRDVDFTALTHIAHFSVVPNPNGTVQIPNWGPFPDTGLLSAAHAAGVKVILVVGTGDDSAVTANFAAMAASAATRTAFAQNLTTLVAQYGYDGVELDWEFPASAADRTNLTALCAALRSALGAGRTLSLSAPSSNWNGQWYELANLNSYLDWFSVMTYDMSGAGWSHKAEHNAALFPAYAGEDNAAASMAYYQSFGIARSKILMGLPFFGQRFDAATAILQPLTPPSAGGSADYKDIAPLIGNGWNAFRDTTAQVPYLVRSGGAGVIAYDDATSIAAKCSYVKSNGLGGAMIWHLGKDRIGSGQPLLQAAKGCR